MKKKKIENLLYELRLLTIIIIVSTTASCLSRRRQWLEQYNILGTKEPDRPFLKTENGDDKNENRLAFVPSPPPPPRCGFSYAPSAEQRSIYTRPRVVRRFPSPRAPDNAFWLRAFHDENNTSFEGKSYFGQRGGPVDAPAAVAGHAVRFILGR